MTPIPPILTISAAFALGFAAAHIPAAPAVAAPPLIASAPYINVPAIPTKFRRQTDAALDDAMHDPRFTNNERLTAFVSRIEFDALCAQDDRFGTHEADTFLDEELARNQRLLNTMEAQRSQP